MEIENLRCVIDHIKNRVDSIVLGSKKRQSEGCKILKAWEGFDDNIDSLVMTCVIALQKKFHFDDGDNVSGCTKLTSAILSLGMIMKTTVSGYPAKTKKDKEEMIELGSVILDALAVNKLIVINKENPGGELFSKKPNMIHATDEWVNRLQEVTKEGLKAPLYGLHTEDPGFINDLFDSNSGRPIIKHCTDEVAFDRMMDKTFMDGLNLIRRTPWRINKDVFDTVVSRGVIKTEHDPIPNEGSKHCVDAALKEFRKEQKKAAKGKPNRVEEAKEHFDSESLMWNKKREALKKRSGVIENCIIYGMADNMKDLEEFYYDVELDYRGRVYYAASYLHYQGNDLAKSLLEFSEPRVVDQEGFRWLLIHAANSYNETFSTEQLKSIDWTTSDYLTKLREDDIDNLSVDKMSLTDRYNWAVRNYNMILRTGMDRLVQDGADKPLAFLAVCIDLAKLEEAINNDELYFSHLPIPVDGSSNGCQHTAAINRDRDTGSLVGLTKTEYPVDLYVKVGKEIKEMESEFFKEHDMPMKDIRKCISKRATMTRQYSAGKATIADSMFADCYKYGATEKYGITAPDCEILSASAVEAIDNVCPSNRTVRGFLQELVKFELGTFEYHDENGEDQTKYRNSLKRELDSLNNSKDDTSVSRKGQIYNELKRLKRTLVAGNGEKKISWTTPAGFEVNSEFFQKETTEKRVSINGKQYAIVYLWETEIVDVSKHISAIAANMVHSLDSTHMLSVCAEWATDTRTESRSFGAVHDSFAVHATDVEILLDNIKSSFIDMYKGKDVYQSFIDNILSKTDGFDLQKPELGDLDLDEIYQSDYFFS